MSENKETDLCGRFRYLLPKDLPLVSKLMAALRVKRPNSVSGSSLPNCTSIFNCSHTSKGNPYSTVKCIKYNFIIDVTGHKVVARVVIPVTISTIKGRKNIFSRTLKRVFSLLWEVTYLQWCPTSA